MYTEVVKSYNDIKSGKVPYTDQSSYDFLD